MNYELQNHKMILLVEDDKNMIVVNKMMLESKGYIIETATTLAEAQASLEKRTPAAIILDRGMPDGDGVTLLARLRKTSRIPVLILTGHNEKSEIIEGFDTGCDDYVTKPVESEVVLLKLQSLLRRAEQIPETITKGPFTLKIMSDEALVNGESLYLTQKEFSLLVFFTQNEGRIIDAEYLYEQVWGQPMGKNDGALRSQISNLRKKLSDSGYTISHNHGEGYSFERQ